MSYRLFVGLLERYRSGYNGPDSKSGWLNSHVGSNPTLSAKETVSELVSYRVEELKEITL